MLRTNESETEILLGNKQLLGIFFVVAILLGIAFTGGYMVGRGSVDKATDVRSSATRSTNAAETHAVAPESADDDRSTGSLPVNPQAKPSASNPPPLGSPPGIHSNTTRTSASSDAFAPERGQTFLQVAAVGRDEAQGIADVLHKKGFRAHAVPKPGDSKFYRVLIGPIRDTADLSSTRDSLRKTGFREVIVQKYQ
ncbi:MAG: SPOR domain-containing protein [Bryobacteraceae bacterium]